MPEITFADRLARHEAFLVRRPVDRPLIGYWRGGYYPAEQFPRGTADWQAGRQLHTSDVCFSRFAEDNEALYRANEAADDDFFHLGSLSFIGD